MGSVLFDSGTAETGGQPALFDAPRALIRADRAEEVPAALSSLAAALSDGQWIAGFAAYELGYALEPRLEPLMPPERRGPLLQFGVFDGPRAGRLATPAGRLTPPRPVWSEDEHGAAVGRVLDYIRAGDCYQVNLTFPLSARWEGTPAGLHAALARRQPVGHGALVDLGGPVILSRSPELFLATRADGTIEVRPMKGTAPRDPDPTADAALRAGLATSAKDRAENLMIVDLMRNDLSRICAPGSIRVPELFAVESYATVHQMTSRVTGELRAGVGIDGVLRALFPCGSVTGAPKIRAMEIIRELEPFPRGAYCGTVGWAAPDGRASFNVAIRTLTLFPGGEAVLNVGGGIVADSTPGGEYEEALWKARFAEIG